MAERKTDADFHAEIDELDKQGRYALAMQRAVREADRARMSEERLAKWARFIIRQGCSGNARACASEPCSACRAKADLLTAGLEAEL